MVTVAHVVEKLVKDQPQLEDAIERDIVSYAKLADYLKPEVEQELGREVKHGAVVMALTRLSEKLKDGVNRALNFEKFGEVEMSIRSDVMETTIVKSPKSFEAVKRLYDLVDFEGGDVLNVIQGNHEITIIASRRYSKKFESELRGEKIIRKIGGLSSLSIKFPPALVETPGFFSLVTRQLAWHGVNIIEMVSTLTELTIVLEDKNITKAYGALQERFKKLEQKEL
ncbi:MAG: hypothetical protein V1909_01945 [Candidatus Micrarchaeota archaeon]